MNPDPKKLDVSTEAKIKEAARKVFLQKGFNATRTRDIAEEANINLALLNYYFRSKEKLFNIIILETMQGFFKFLTEMLNDTSTSFDLKIELISNNYIDLLIKNPDIPIFLLSEIRRNPEELMEKIHIKDVLLNSHFMQQLKEGIQSNKYKPIHPLQFLMNLLGMLVFPFIASPMIKRIGSMSDDEFNQLIEQRRILVPQWIKALITANSADK